MDWWLILLRILHVGSAMSWFGGAIIGGFFLQPTANALGPAGQPFMDYLLRRRGMGISFPIVVTLTVLSGAALYWRDSAGSRRRGSHRRPGWRTPSAAWQPSSRSSAASC